MSAPSYTFSYYHLLACYGSGFYTELNHLELHKDLKEVYNIQLIKWSKSKNPGYNITYKQLPLTIRIMDTDLEPENFYPKEECVERCNNIMMDVMKNMSAVDFIKWINAIEKYNYKEGRNSLRTDVKRLLERE